MLVSIYNVSPNSVTFDLETAEIRSVIVTQPINFTIFRHCRASYTNAIELRPTKFFQVLEGLRGLLSTVKSLGKFVPKNFDPA